MASGSGLARAASGKRADGSGVMPAWFRARGPPCLFLFMAGTVRGPGATVPMGKTPARLPVLSLAQARTLHLAAQGLLHPPRRRARPADVTDAVARMRMLQIDSIHVIARSPYMVLFARLGAYPPAWLDQALEAGRLAECWAHEACFVPAADYPWHAASRGLRDGHWAHRHARRMASEQSRTLRDLLRQVRERGPVLARELASERKRGSGWWNWSTQKAGLEALFARGELMVARRQRFERVYDLAEHVQARMRSVAGSVVDAAPDAQAVRERFVLDAVRALGVARGAWIGDYHRMGAVPQSMLEALAARGDLLRTAIDGLEGPAWVHREHAGLARRVAAGRLRATRVSLLSPFDPVVWDRQRARELFDFDYALECYTPARKRRYGYYVLPVLGRGRLMARVDAKAHRRDGVFEARGVFMQPGQATGRPSLHAVARALGECARWHDTPRVTLGRCEPASIRAPLARLLDQRHAVD